LLHEDRAVSELVERENDTGAVSLRWRHWTTILLLSATVLVNMLLTGKLVEEAQSDNVINHAGRQRMLIQELGYQISEMITLIGP